MKFESGARVVVINVARIGDTLLITPVLRAIKQACAAVELTCLAHPKRAAVLQNLPWLDQLAVMTPKRARYRGRFSKGYRWDYALVYGRDAPLQHPALAVVEHPRSDAARSREVSMAEITVDQVWQPFSALLDRRLNIDAAT